MSRVDNLFNLTNYREHPEDKSYWIFFYYKMEQADYFEACLIEERIKYESFLEEETKRPVKLFAIHKHDFERANRLNEKSYAEYKTKFIPNKGLRYGLLIFVVALVIFALIGSLLSA